MEKVAIYMRKSRAEEKEEALANHRAVLTRLAESKGFEYDVFDEIGSSISLDWRTEFNRLIENLASYSYVLVMDIDRLARDLVSMETIKKLFRANNVNIMTPTQVIDLQDSGQELVMDFQSVIAKAEYQQIRKRLKIGKVEGARQGHWVNGVAPLGYSYNRQAKKLELNEQELPAVQMVFKLALENKSYKEIAINMNLKGFKTRKGREFSCHSVKAILNNRAYMGDVTYRQSSVQPGEPDQVIISHDSHSPIIKEIDFLEVQGILSSRSKGKGIRQVYKPKAITQGLVFCGVCGHKMGLNTAPGGKTAYRCTHEDSIGQPCSNHSYPTAPIDEAVSNSTLLQIKEDLIEQAKAVIGSNTAGKKTDIVESLEQISSKIAKVQSRKDALLDSMLDGIVDKTIYKAKNDEMTAQLQELQDNHRLLQLQLDELTSNKQVARLRRVIRILEDFSILPVEEANSVLSTFIDKILLTVTVEATAYRRKGKKEPEIRVLLKSQNNS